MQLTLYHVNLKYVWKLRVTLHIIHSSKMIIDLNTTSSNSDGARSFFCTAMRQRVVNKMLSTCYVAHNFAYEKCSPDEKVSKALLISRLLSCSQAF